MSLWVKLGSHTNHINNVTTTNKLRLLFDIGHSHNCKVDVWISVVYEQTKVKGLTTAH